MSKNLKTETDGVYNDDLDEYLCFEAEICIPLSEEFNAIRSEILPAPSIEEAVLKSISHVLDRSDVDYHDYVDIYMDIREKGNNENIKWQRFTFADVVNLAKNREKSDKITLIAGHSFYNRASKCYICYANNSDKFDGTIAAPKATSYGKVLPGGWKPTNYIIKYPVKQGLIKVFENGEYYKLPNFKKDLCDWDKAKVFKVGVKVGEEEQLKEGTFEIINTYLDQEIQNEKDYIQEQIKRLINEGLAKKEGEENGDIYSARMKLIGENGDIIAYARLIGKEGESITGKSLDACIFSDGTVNIYYPNSQMLFSSGRLEGNTIIDSNYYDTSYKIVPFDLHLKQDQTDLIPTKSEISNKKQQNIISQNKKHNDMEL